MDDEVKSFFIGIITTLIVLGIGWYLLFGSATRKLEAEFKKENYETAVTMYNGKFYNTSKEEKGDKIVRKYIGKLEKSYSKGKKTAEEVVELLNQLYALDKVELVNEAEQYCTDILSYDRANQSYEEKKYYDAAKCYAQVSEGSTFYKKAQSKMEKCRDALVDSLIQPVGKREYEKALSNIENYLEIYSGDSEMIEYRDRIQKEYDEIVENAARVTYINQLQESFYRGNYEKVFSVLQEALKELPKDGALKNAAAKYDEMFFVVINGIAQTLVKDRKYDEAIRKVNEALEIHKSDEIQELLEKVQAEKSADKTYSSSADVTFTRFSGNIVSADQQDVYELKTAVSGIYGVTFEDTSSELMLNLNIADESGQSLIDEADLQNASSISANLIKDQTYRITVSGMDSMGKYVLSIGHAKEVVDLSSYDEFHDKIEFVKQINSYSFKPESDGTYQINLLDIEDGVTVDFRAVNDSDSAVENGEQTGLADGSIVLLQLQGGTNYNFYIGQNEGLGQYSIKIERPD